MTTTDLTPITLDSGIKLFPTCAEVPDGLPIEDYEQAIAMLDFLGRGHGWHIGDLLLSAEAVHGDEVYNRVSERTGLGFSTLAAMHGVAKRFVPSRRLESVDWSFYQSLASIEDDEQQDALLREAEAEQYTLVQFRAKVRNARSGFAANRNGYSEDGPDQAEQNRLAAGDRVEVADLAQSPWPAGEVDLIVMSPPYGTGMAYSDGGDIDSWDDYLDAIAAWSSALVRLLNPRHGRLALNVPLDRSDNAGKRGRPAYLGRPVYAAWVNALVDAGLNYRSSIVWWDNQAGEGNQRGSVDSPAAPHIVAPAEMIVLGYMGSWSRSSERAHDLSHETWLEELGPRGVWQINGEQDRSEHPAPFPPELPERLVRLLSFRSDLVADPMCGRGTVGTVAARLGRKVWLADRSPEYVQIARRALIEARGLAEKEKAAA